LTPGATLAQVFIGFPSSQVIDGGLSVPFFVRRRYLSLAASGADFHGDFFGFLNATSSAAVFSVTITQWMFSFLADGCQDPAQGGAGGPRYRRFVFSVGVPIFAAGGRRVLYSVGVVATAVEATSYPPTDKFLSSSAG
jgi:hypothetical protein